MNLFQKSRGLIAIAAAMVIMPAVANAWALSGSYISGSADGVPRESSRYPGPSTGTIRLCGDVSGSIAYPTGGSRFMIWRDISYSPDQLLADRWVYSADSAFCGSGFGSSTTYYYYTAVNPLWSSGITWWANAQT